MPKKQKGAGRGESTRLDEGTESNKALFRIMNAIQSLARNSGGNPERRKRGPGEEQNRGEGSRTHLRRDKTQRNSLLLRRFRSRKRRRRERRLAGARREWDEEGIS